MNVVRSAGGSGGGASNSDKYKIENGKR